MPSDLTGGVEFNHDNLDDKATDMQNTGMPLWRKIPPQ